MKIKDRYKILGFGCFLAFVMLFVTDPDSGIFKIKYMSSSVAFLMGIFVMLLYVGFHHICMKGISDWFDYEEHNNNAKKSPVGSGLAMCSQGLWGITIALVFIAAKM